MQETGLALNRCDKCGAEAKIVLPYGPHRFCAKHFNEFFEHRMRKTTRMSGMVKYGEKIAVGVSGGKDSMVTLHLLNKIFGATGQNKIEAIMIDEGIPGYRDRAIEIATAYCQAQGIPCHVVRYDERLGTDMSEIARKIHEDTSLGSTCSFCGVFRRDLLNEKALGIKADKLATGHNLDDEVQSIVMSFFGNDVSRLARLGEVAGNRQINGFVPRIKPLYETPEKEVIAYAALNGIEHYSEECCPHSWMAKRNTYRKLLNELEGEMPGTKHGILSAFRKLKPKLIELEKSGASEIMECARCGKPSNAELCGTCRQLDKIRTAKGPGEQNDIYKPQDALSCAQTKRL